MNENQRITPRYPLIHPIQLGFGTQIILQGHIKDISLKSAFIQVKGSIQMSLHDALTFKIENIPNLKGTIEGEARISRVAIGEGIVIYFTKINSSSTGLLERLITSVTQ